MKLLANFMYLNAGDLRSYENRLPGVNGYNAQLAVQKVAPYYNPVNGIVPAKATPGSIPSPVGTGKKFTRALMRRVF